MFLCSGVYAQELKEIGNWTVFIEVNPLTDEGGILLMHVTDEDYNKNKLLNDMKMLIIARIETGKQPALFITWNKYLGDNTLIRYRFDKGEIHEEHWTQSENKEALSYPEDKELKSFIRNLLNAERLIVGIKPHNKSEEVAVFSLEGLKEAITPYLANVGWEDLLEESTE